MIQTGLSDVSWPKYVGGGVGPPSYANILNKDFKICQLQNPLQVKLYRHINVYIIKVLWILIFSYSFIILRST